MSDKTSQTAERDARAATMYPREWAAAISRTGPAASKKRQQLRRNAEMEIERSKLRATGACCGNCRSYEHGSNPLQPKRFCGALSDFHGYVTPPADDLCLKWSASA